MPTVDQILRVDFGYFVRPADEVPAGTARVEPLLGYVIPLDDGVLLFDTGMGECPPDLDARYRPARRPLGDALGSIGVGLGDVRWIVNCHLHFDHCGGNPELTGVPIVVQKTELAAARTVANYTLPSVIDFAGARYEEIEGETELVEDVRIVPTPGHTEGHQSLVVRCNDGTVVVAGQAYDQAAELTFDQLAWRARGDGRHPPLPSHREWLSRLLELDPRRVVFAHDNAVWEPAGLSAGRAFGER